FRRTPSPRAALRFPAHRAAGIEQEVHVEVLLLLEELYEEAVEPTVDVPVDRAGIIPRDVVPEVGEFQARADLARGPIGAIRTPEGAAGEDVQLLELRKKPGVEKQRRVSSLQSGV